MASTVETIRQLTIQARTVGVDEARQKLENTSRSLGTMEGALARVERAYEPLRTATDKLTAVSRTLTLAVAAGNITQERSNQLYDQAVDKLTGYSRIVQQATTAEIRAREAREASARAAARLSQDSLNSRLGVRTAPARDYEADFRAAAAAADALQGKLVPLIGVQQRYLAALTEIGGAQRAGIITVDQGIEARARETASYQRNLEVIERTRVAVQAANQAVVNKQLGVAAPSGRDGGADMEAAIQAAERLRGKYDPLFAAQMTYRASLAEVRSLLSTGAITQDQYAAAVDRVKTAFVAQMEAQGRSSVATRAAAAAAKEAAAAEEARAAAAAKWNALSMVGAKAYREATDPNARANARLSSLSGPAPMSAAERDALAAAVDPLADAAQKRDRQLALADRALKTGAVNEEGYRRSVAQTTAVFMAQERAIGTFIRNTEQAAKGAKLSAYEIQNLSFQFNDVATSLASGIPLMQTAAQQGGQIYQVMAGSKGGVKGALVGIGEMALGAVRGLGLLGGAFSAVAAVAIAGAVAWRSYANTQKEVRDALTGVGRGSGTTVDQINAIAAASAEAGGVSTREARSMAAAFAATGQIGSTMYGELISKTKDYALSTGQELADAAKELGGAFADPTKGADLLNERLGGLNDRTVQSIRNLQAQGDRLGAQRALFEALSQNVTRSSDLMTGWGRIMETVGNKISGIWDKVGESIDKAITGGTIENQISTLEARLAQLDRMRGGLGGLFDYRNNAETAEVQQQLGALRSEQARRRQQGESVAAAGRNRDVMDLARSLDPAQKELQDTTNAADKLRRAISDPIRFGLDGAQLAMIQAQFERLQNVTRSMREDMERFGSVAAGDAVRGAQNANANVGLNSVDKAIAERQQKLDADLRAKGWDALTSRDEVNRQYMDKASAPNLDARDLSSLQAEREARLRVIAERDAYITVAQTEISTIRKTAEEAAKRTAVSGDFVSAMINVESRGDASARNSRSSATGLGQFITETWDRLFKKTFPERASGMSDPEIAARRTNRDDSIALIKVYAEENQRALEKAGLDTSNRNQYLAWFAGAQGAIKLLRADPGTDATSLLGQQAAKANPTIIPGKSAGDVINWADRTINKNQAGVRSTEREAGILRSQVTLTEQTTEAESRRAKVQELLNDAISRGTEVGRQFSTAQELLGAKADNLTDTARNERAAILEVADAYAKQAAAVQNSALMRDLLFERSQIGRSTDEAAVASRLRGTGLGMDSAEASALRLNQTLSQTKDIGKDAFGGWVSDIMRGTNALDALKNSLMRVLDKLLSSTTDKLFSGLFDGIGKAGGGGGFSLFNPSSWFSGAGGGGVDVGASSWMPKFATGGYTGAGGVHQPAGVVHRGEVVWSQRDVARAGGVAAVEAMRLGMRGYAVGGPVGDGYSRQPPAANQNQGGGPVAVAVNVSNVPADHSASATVTQTPKGPRVDIQLEKMVGGMVADGRLDTVMRKRYGMRATG
ncbi:phage tail length tape measure family protein [Methylobacterium platani]|uniref:Uncharacterized protein n=1 Tax=Methylobacterium platani TaxID=427683 RepID=A0A179SI91_9HYPH|nr:phage tail length tape measure family protein [Methylobacterium platani]OAS26283.1 hypothetical protein A5481_06075 [Methylobacterium platani]